MPRDIKHFIIILWLFCIGVTHAQNQFASSDEMTLAAQNFFQNQEYVKAFPIYSQLLSLDRDDPNLNYRFGVCLLYSDRSDTYAPIDYLKIGLGKVEDPDIYFHLGFAYHINYNFPAAISYYEEYKTKAGRKANKSFETDRKIEMCRNGMQMMRSVKDLFVLEKNEVARAEFFRSYNLKEYGGRMIRKPENFLSKTDQKKGEEDFIFFNSKSNAIYYSAYGKDNKDQKDIYRRTKTPDGEWSEPERLPDIINSPYDDDFAIMMPDGKTLYFSSKGHNTMGGFDIFKSVFNDQTKQWSTPENINFPFNTPVDDILFVSDTNEATAWFASVRNSVENKIIVYKVGIIKRPGGSEDMASIYNKNKMLTAQDLKRIQDLAKLDVNISEREYDEIPDSEPIVEAEVLHEQNTVKLAAEIDKKGQEQQIIDSARLITIKLENKIDQLDSIRQKAVSIAASKKVEASRLKKDVKQSMKLVSMVSDPLQLEKLIDNANLNIANAERLEYEASELSSFAYEMESQIEKQNQVFQDITKRYGDAEQAVLQGNKDRALAIIGGMNVLLDEAPEINDFPLVSQQNTSSEQSLIEITYPSEIANPETYQAFVVNAISNPPTVETFDARFEEYLVIKPEEGNVVKNQDFSNNPSQKIKEYIGVLQDKSNSIDIQIRELNDRIEKSKEEILNAKAEQKAQKLIELNLIVADKTKLINQNEWLKEQIGVKNEAYEQIVLSSNDPDIKNESYQKMSSELEQGFDFDKTMFMSDFNLPITQPAYQYTINNAGKLVEESVSVTLIPSSEIEFTQSSQELIKNQTTQMLSEVRTADKMNQFGLQKLQRNFNMLEGQASVSFNEANDLLDLAKNTSIGNRPTALDQANIKFDEARNLILKLNAYKGVEKKILENSEDAKRIINEMNDLRDQINESSRNNDFSTQQLAYSKLEKTYNNFQVMADFSTEFNVEDGSINEAIIKNQESLPSAYQIDQAGNITKSFGDPTKDWNSIDGFASESLSPQIINLAVSPNFSYDNKTESFADIFAPSSLIIGQRIAPIENKIPPILKNETNSLVQNTLDQFNNLEASSNQLISKRNKLQDYYENSLAEIKALEASTLENLQNGTISQEKVDEANRQSFETKKKLYKLSVVAGIIQQYDNKIIKQAQLMQDALKSAQEMQTLVSNNNQDEALLKNVQLQRKVANINSENIDDSAFNYAVNEVFIETPSVISDPQNREFLIVNNQLQRNDFAQLNQFLYQQSPQIDINLSTSSLINSVNSSDPILNTSSSGQSANDNNGKNSGYNGQEIKISIYDSQKLNDPSKMRLALSDLNSFAQNHVSNIDDKSNQLTQLAENKLSKSNNFSIQSEQTNDLASKRELNDSAKIYLYQALALKDLIEGYQKYSDEERKKQEIITQTSFEIENKLNTNDLGGAMSSFRSMQEQIGEFGQQPSKSIQDLYSNLSNQSEKLSMMVDSAYQVSQELSNQSVMLLSQAAEDRQEAEGKRNAFKRRELLKSAEEKEIEATRLQNESEKALSFGNEQYQKNQLVSSLPALKNEIIAVAQGEFIPGSLIANQTLVFENIDDRKAEIIDGKLNTASQQKEQSNGKTPLADINDVQVYQREFFKAEMISEELELMKREIALLVQSQNTGLSEKEAYIVSHKINLLRQKADSLEYEANKAFDFANRILNILSDEEKTKAKTKNRSFDDYLTNLKSKIELLLSEAASFKQRAQRSNNMDDRENLYNQAKDKEEVAMYLILEEFEVIAQKNKTRYRKNQLILEQLMMDMASERERELMRGIFSQVDEYFAQAQEKRAKANEENLSFNMRKILLQDAYSLEMKALDLQQQAKTILENHDMNAMIELQPKEQERSSQEIVAQQIAENNTQESSNTVSPNTEDVSNDQVIDMITDSQQGFIYRVQFTALKEIRSTSSFPNIREISAQKVNGTDYIRYFSGEFLNIEDAIIRRNNIRTVGYADAFIKSWRDGEEVSLVSLDNISESQSINTLIETSAPTSINNIDFSATNISYLQGVYYSVQVGVYSRPRTSAKIFGIKPLYHKRLSNGYWVYYSGIYKTIASANTRKEEIVEKGVSDAFVVAFNDGQSIGLADARSLLSRGEQSPPEDAIVILEDASLQIENQWNMTQTSVVSNEVNEPTKYKVQIGVYTNPINLDWITSQLDDVNKVESYQNNNGKYVFTIGNFDTEEQARELLQKVIELIPDAFVVGFQNGQKRYIR